MRYNTNRWAMKKRFLAMIHSPGKLPESEMQKIGMFGELPENLTYPQRPDAVPGSGLVAEHDATLTEED